jgi:hypothetical protein
MLDQAANRIPLRGAAGREEEDAEGRVDGDEHLRRRAGCYIGAVAQTSAAPPRCTTTSY